MPTSYKFGVRDAKIATWTTTSSYGTLVDLNAVNRIEVQVQTTSAQLEGDDVIADTHAQPTSVRVRVVFGAGAQIMDVLSTLTGETLGSSGGIRTLVNDDGNYPYIGFRAQVYQTNGTGDNHLIVPKCKLMDGFSYSAAYGGYVIPEITLMGVLDSTNGFFQIKEHDTAVAISAILP